MKLSLLAVFLSGVAPLLGADPPNANRFTYLDSDDPFYPDRNLPRFTTPQWIGEAGVEAAVIISIDDLRETAKYENYLRPVLERLKKIDGRAPVSILCNQAPTDDPLFQKWLGEGVSLEVHTLTHPCPLLANSDFAAASKTFQGGIDLLAKIPNNRPVAFRMPCCDSMNSASPRFFAELFRYPSEEKRSLSIDSSVMCLLTSADKANPREAVLDADGKERFRKYFAMELVPPRKVTFERFAGYIEDYPYPYVIGGHCWEFPCVVPSDWEAFNTHGSKNPRTLEDWKAALDIIVAKQGVMTMILHPHGWSDPQQIVELIDHAVTKYGNRVKFLNFREALERIAKNALGGQRLSSGNRLVDVNADGFMDIVVPKLTTRVWNPERRQWDIAEDASPLRSGSGTFWDFTTVIGVLAKTHSVSRIEGVEKPHVFEFNGGKWTACPELEKGLEGALAGSRITLRDFDRDGICELIASRPNKSEIFRWSAEEHRWNAAPFALPGNVSARDERGFDNGLRFVDLNGDGFDDILFSNPERFGIYLWAKHVNPGLGWNAGWSHVVRAGTRTGAANEPPPIVRAGEHPNNGAWFRNAHLVIQNEDTSKLEGVVDWRSFKELIAFDVPPPKSAEEALKSFRVRPGFRVELVAAEPLVIDPVAFEWDARGRLWVVEMRDYPLGMDGNGKPGGVIKILEDTDGDGRYDKATTFLENVPFPSGVMPFRNGAIISTAPDLLFAEDTNDDGRADTQRPLFTGFKPGNQQHRVNGFEWGLDNWLYCANGDSGGIVKSLATGKSVAISGRDFAFQPDTGEMRAIEGQTQFGRRVDDWGNWFGNNNPTWLWHYPTPERYVARNPQLAMKNPRHVLANYDEPTRVFPVSAPLLRFNQPQSLNHVTSACSACPYRDDLFGADFAESVFVSEPVHNVVHREIVSRDGIRFHSRRADDEQTNEFLASSDNWFRPTTLKAGPDGALYIADMYRFVLEHPEWIAPETQARLDLRAGEDKGRIYRVVPDNKPRRPIPNLAALETHGLVAALDSPNGWQRANAQRLLIERRDPRSGELLRELVARTTNAKARLHALCTLDALDSLTPAIIVSALHDAHRDVRRHALRLAEPALAQGEREVIEAVITLQTERDPIVRHQLALSLGAARDPRAAEALGGLLGEDADEDMRLAVLSSAPAHLDAMINAVVNRKPGNPLAVSRETLRGLLPLADMAALESFVAHVIAYDPARSNAAQFQLVAAVLEELSTRDEKNSPTAVRASLAQCAPFVTQARQSLADGAARDPAIAAAATACLGWNRSEEKIDIEALRKVMGPQFPSEVQNAAVDGLARIGNREAARGLFAGWPTFSPNLREAVLRVATKRNEGCHALLDALANRVIGSNEIPLATQQSLIRHQDRAVQERANLLLTPVERDRQQIVDRYLKTVGNTGDPKKGHEIYRAQCSTCHRCKGEGFEVGPDLEMVAGKPIQQLLAALLDPNAAIEPRYLAYTAKSREGTLAAGIITAESTHTIVLRAPGGVETKVARADLEQLTALGTSLMPEGLEQAITPEAMADLFSYLRTSAPAGK